MNRKAVVGQGLLVSQKSTINVLESSGPLRQVAVGRLAKSSSMFCAFFKVRSNSWEKGTRFGTTNEFYNFQIIIEKYRTIQDWSRVRMQYRFHFIDLFIESLNSSNRGPIAHRKSPLGQWAFCISSGVYVIAMVWPAKCLSACIHVWHPKSFILLSLFSPVF
jgi:hypothetical protein